MSKQYQQKWPVVNKEEPCDICGKDHSCRRSPDNQVALCKRVEVGAFKTAPGGWYLHHLGDAPRMPLALPAPKPKRPAKAYPTLQAAIDAVVRMIGGSMVSQWTYHRSDGNEAFRVLRFQDGDGDKQYRPVHQAKDGWRLSDPSGLLPLYRLKELPQSGPVWITEGEKAADAASVIGLPATTSAHGAQSPEKTDWSPLAGKEVVVLPDNDDPGRQYAQKVAEILMKLDPPANVKVYALPGLPEKGDIVQFIEARAGQSPAAIQIQVQAQADATAYVESSETIGGPVLTCLADVEPQEVQWLWPGRFGLGKLSVLFGDPGKGKSFITLDMAARVSTGSAWPDGSGDAPLGSVVLVNCEDEAGDTIRPRLDRAHANVRKIHLLDAVKRPGFDGKLVERGFMLKDVPALAQALRRHPDVKLVIIDPVSAYMSDTDSHKDAAVRGLLAPLAKMATTYDVAVVMVMHMNKGEGGPAMHRAMGSVAFIAAARAAWAVACDRENPERRLMLPAKNNLGNDKTGLAYRIIDGAVSWEKNPVQMTADDVLGSAFGNSASGPEPYARDEATQWLSDVLADGPVTVAQIERSAKEAGLSWTGAVRRAMRVLKIKPYKGQFNDGWYWKLPESPTPPTMSSADADSGDTPEVRGRVGLPDAPYCSDPGRFSATDDDDLLAMAAGDGRERGEL